jgi:hypothetical protein
MGLKGKGAVFMRVLGRFCLGKCMDIAPICFKLNITSRHSYEGGNLGVFNCITPLDSRFRGNDNL